MTQAAPGAAAAATRIVLVEGIPGSGKTTTAAWLCGWLHARGVAAAWAREEAAEHPVMGTRLRRTAREAGYTDRCVASWRAYAARACEGDGPTRVEVLEGCFFQSSVRLLLEHEHGIDEPLRYLRGTEEALAPLRPLLVHLEHDDPRAFLEEHLEARKGDEIVARIAAYTETTACARRHGWTGRSGMMAFYAHYARVCAELVAATTIPTLHVDATRSEWPDVARRVAGWLMARGVGAGGRAGTRAAHAPPAYD